MGINFLKNRLKLKDGNVYVIHCTKRDDDWYFVEFDDDFNKVVWTAYLDKAQIFTTEEGVEDFKMVYLSDRVCNILRIE